MKFSNITQDMENAQNINTMSSDYYTALSLEESNSPTMLYDDIQRETDGNEEEMEITNPNIEMVPDFHLKIY